MEAKKQSTKEFILEVAATEIYRNGYEGTSFTDLIKKTNLSKGAFYHYFKSKKHLCLELIEKYSEREIHEEWLSRFNTPLNTINILLKAIENKIILYYKNGDYKYGSALNNLLNEQSGIDKEIKNSIDNSFDLWIDETAKFIKRGQKAEYVKKNFDAKLLAQYFVQNSISALQILKIKQDCDEAINYFKILRKTARMFRAE